MSRAIFVSGAVVVMLYWQICKKINDELSQYSSTETYGKNLVATLWRQLETDYGVEMLNYFLHS